MAEDQDSASAPTPALTPKQLLAQMQAEEAAVPMETEDESALKEIEALRRLKEARAKYPGQDLKRVDTMAGTYILKRADRDQMRRFRELSIDKDTKLEALDVLNCACVVAPAREIYLAEWDAFPAVPDQISNKAIEFCGAGGVTEKKVAKRS